MQALTKTLKFSFSIRSLMSSMKACMHSGGYLVFDCDAGTDDAWALLTLLKTEQLFPLLQSKKCNDGGDNRVCEPYKILGVTCVQGNAELPDVVKNVLRVLDSVDRLDVPVYKGCANPIVPRSWKRKLFYHGKDGFGDVPNLPEVTKVKVQPESAVIQMYKFACQYPNMVDFLLVGPLTNFATCITLYGNDFLDKVRSVWIMGGNTKAKGNNSRTAEFNFHMDPEAAHIVLNSLKFAPTIVPWETCVDYDMNPSTDWRLNVLGKVDTKAMKLMNTVEKAVLLPMDAKEWVICDAALVASYCFPQLIIEKCTAFNSTVELNGTFTRAQMVLDHLYENKPNTCVVTRVHSKNYKDMLSWVGGMIDNDKFKEIMKLN